MKKSLLVLLAALVALPLAGCTEADTVEENLTKEADSFQVNRRVVFFNGITDKYLLTIEGLCSLGNNDNPRNLTVTCKTGNDQYKKHFLGLSDNVSFFVEQIDGANIDPFHYKVIFRPEAIIPDIDLQTSND